MRTCVWGLVGFGSVQWASAGFDQNAAIEYAKLSGAAYCSTSSLHDWNCGEKCSARMSSVKVIQGKTTKAFVGRWSSNTFTRRCLLSVQGTSNLKAWVTDLKFHAHATSWSQCNNCKVHGGFLDEWYSLKNGVKQSLEDIGCGAGSSLYITGHSLGAATAGIAMMSLSDEGWNVVESYNFGMPRTGDESFAQQFNAKFHGRFHRVTHHKDPVPHLPPMDFIVDWHFQHVEPEVFYDGGVDIGYTECTVAGDNRCAHMYSNLLVDVFHVKDHLDYMGVHTGGAGCGGALLDIAV